MQKQVINSIKQVFKGILIFDVLVLIVLLLIGKFTQPMIFGLLVGSVTAVFCFYLLALNLESLVSKEIGPAKVFSVFGYSFRMLLCAAILIVSAKVDQISMITTVIGLISTQVVILFKNLILDKYKSKSSIK